MKSLSLLAVLLFIATLLSSCSGYRLGSNKPAKLAGIQKLAIPTFRNHTLEPRLAALLTNNVISQFQLDGTYRIGSAGSSDAILHGVIKEVERRPFRLNRRNLRTSDEIQFTIHLEYFLEGADGKLVTKGDISGSTHTVIDSNFQASERQGMEDASLRLAQKLSSRLSEGW